MPELHFDELTSPIGTILVVFDREDTVYALDFLDYRSRMLSLLKHRFGEVQLTSRTSHHLRGVFDAYFAGDLAALDGIRTDSGGTEFQRKVWTALRQIPPGKTACYGEIAERLCCPSAARAVGLANSLNPIAIVVPCHRVIGANGKLTGYAGGLERKRWLLEHERNMAKAQGSNPQVSADLHGANLGHLLVKRRWSIVGRR